MNKVAKIATFTDGKTANLSNVSLFTTRKSNLSTISAEN